MRAAWNSALVRSSDLSRRLARPGAERLAREHDVAFVPFYLEGVAGIPALNQGDGIHPNPEGHRSMARTLWPRLEPALDALLDHGGKGNLGQGDVAVHHLAGDAERFSRRGSRRLHVEQGGRNPRFFDVRHFDATSCRPGDSPALSVAGSGAGALAAALGASDRARVRLLVALTTADAWGALRTAGASPRDAGAQVAQLFGLDQPTREEASH